MKILKHPGGRPLKIKLDKINTPRAQEALKPAEEVYVRELTSGKSSKESALIAGYSKSNLSGAGHRLLNRPRVQRRLAQIRDRLSKPAVTRQCANTLVASISATYTDRYGEQPNWHARLRGIELIGKFRGELQPENNGNTITVLNINDIDGDINVTADAKSS